MDFEWALLAGDSRFLTTDSSSSGADRSAVEDLLHGRYAKVLASPLASSLLLPLASPSSGCANGAAASPTNTTPSFFSPRSTGALIALCRDPKAVVSDLSTRLDAAISEGHSQLSILAVGAALVFAFVQHGFTGPSLDTSTLAAVISSDHLQKASFALLQSDGEEAYSLTPNISLLALARIVLVDCSSKFDRLPSRDWWKLRVLMLQQRILENPAATLSDALMDTCKLIQSSLIETAETGLPKELVGRLWQEFGLVHFFYGRVKDSTACFRLAEGATGLKWELTGALGKRTKFQTFDVAQLVVVAESGSGESADVSATPSNLALNDDTLLEKLELTNENEKTSSKLSTIDQCTLLAFCLNVKNSNPQDGLTNEEMSPYVARILENPNNWMVHSMALLLRSRLEANKGRTVERSVLQIQALVDQMESTESTVAERLNFFFSLIFPSKWDMERELAERLVSIGVIKSALEIFERLQMWDDVISCYQMLEKPKKAEELIRRELEKNPNSPKFLCLLGDVTKDHTYYLEAWEKSGNSYSRAMRSLGSHFFKQGQFSESVSSFKLALAINPLFENSWFIMGCAAIRAEDWENAELAFRRVVQLDAENGEAWTNLASVHISRGKKRDGWRALREALRQHHDNPRIWDNFLFTSIDVGEYTDAVLAMTRIFELRIARGSSAQERLVDLQALRIVVRSLALGATDAAPTDSETDSAAAAAAGADGTSPSTSSLARKVSELLSALTSRISDSAELFAVCAEFEKWRGRYSAHIEYLQKAYRVFLHSPALATDAEMFARGAEAARALFDAYTTYGPMEEIIGVGETRVVCQDWKYQRRMAVRTLASRTKDSFEGTEAHDGLKELLESTK
ncbi:hypothetical protein DFJ73DRAFT_798397 [Zopfochytrium polystomum]|nr:hypothetical protein DFJ73DRAFT_798397 [Zopfochytrium polystomum]